MSNFQYKYLKYKHKYIEEKKLLLQQKLSLKGGGDDAIRIHYGGSFSPPTRAHTKLAIDAITFMVNHILNNKNLSGINKIYFHYAYVHEIYGKSSINTKCVSAKHRAMMLQLTAENVINQLLNNKNPLNKNLLSKREGNGLNLNIQTSTGQRNIMVEVIVEHLEQYLSNPRLEGQTDDVLKRYEILSGIHYDEYPGTYVYLETFCKLYGIHPDRVYLLFGIDNMETMVRGFKMDEIKHEGQYELINNINAYRDKIKTRYWTNAIHLIFKYKILMYPRNNKSLDNTLLEKYLAANIRDQILNQDVMYPNTKDYVFVELNNLNNTNSLSDLNELKDLSDPDYEPILQRIKDTSIVKNNIIEVVVEDVASTDTSITDTSIADTSSSDVREMLYVYNEYVTIFNKKDKTQEDDEYIQGMRKLADIEYIKNKILEKMMDNVLEYILQEKMYTINRGKTCERDSIDRYIKLLKYKYPPNQSK